MAAQVAGGILGVVVANLMFDLDAISIATHQRSSAGLWLGEVVATLGLVIVIFGSLRSGRTGTIAFAVGGYITAAYWFTSSTSSPTPRSPSHECSPTPSPASPPPRSRRSSSCSWSAAPPGCCRPCALPSPNHP